MISLTRNELPAEKEHRSQQCVVKKTAEQKHFSTKQLKYSRNVQKIKGDKNRKNWQNLKLFFRTSKERKKSRMQKIVIPMKGRQFRYPTMNFLTTAVINILTGLPTRTVEETIGVGADIPISGEVLERFLH